MQLDDRKTNASYMLLLGGSPVSRCSRKDSVVTLSLCEDEYIAASLCAFQAVWQIINHIDEISSEKYAAVTLKLDSISAMNEGRPL